MSDLISPPGAGQIDAFPASMQVHAREDLSLHRQGSRQQRFPTFHVAESLPWRPVSPSAGQGS